MLPPLISQASLEMLVFLGWLVVVHVRRVQWPPPVWKALKSTSDNSFTPFIFFFNPCKQAWTLLWLNMAPQPVHALHSQEDYSLVSLGLCGLCWGTFHWWLLITERQKNLRSANSCGDFQDKMPQERSHRPKSHPLHCMIANFKVTSSIHTLGPCKCVQGPECTGACLHVCMRAKWACVAFLSMPLRRHRVDVAAQVKIPLNIHNNRDSRRISTTSLSLLTQTASQELVWKSPAKKCYLLPWNLSRTWSSFYMSLCCLCCRFWCLSRLVSMKGLHNFCSKHQESSCVHLHMSTCICTCVYIYIYIYTYSLYTLCMCECTCKCPSTPEHDIVRVTHACLNRCMHAPNGRPGGCGWASWTLQACGKASKSLSCLAVCRFLCPSLPRPLSLYMYTCIFPCLPACPFCLSVSLSLSICSLFFFVLSLSLSALSLSLYLLSLSLYLLSLSLSLLSLSLSALSLSLLSLSISIYLSRPEGHNLWLQFRKSLLGETHRSWGQNTYSPRICLPKFSAYFGWTYWCEFILNPLFCV